VALQDLLLTLPKGTDTLGPCSLGRRKSDGEPRGRLCTPTTPPLSGTRGPLSVRPSPPTLEVTRVIGGVVDALAAHYWTAKCILCVAPLDQMQAASGRMQDVGRGDGPIMGPRSLERG
jgi:hypothetical protein